MKKLPIGIQSFAKLRDDNCVYVDKTELIYDILTQARQYFLSRPRRFGKSMTLSTIREIFEGNKALFEGLWIENKWDWSKTNPVIHIHEIMKKNILLSFIFSFCFVFKAFSQDTTSVEQCNYCGTMPSKAAWWADFQRARTEGTLRGGDSIIYIPMTIHLLGSDADKGYMTTKPLLDALCQLNKDFETTKIQFYVQGEWHKIAKTAWDNHKTVKEGATMMFANNVPNTLNIYVLTSPAGNCGYNLPYAGIALNRGCITGGKHTWAHEMGHALSLNHPFLGWEGNKLDYAKPAPKKLTYDYTDFKEVYFPNDTLIIDTAYVELMDTSNCIAAADGFCDTRPDYLNYRWECDVQNFSTVQQHD
ncbi:MAG: hypothetical protein RLZZ292_2933, partial [Bacteroidota bacterium]